MAVTLDTTINRMFYENPYYEGRMGVVRSQGYYLKIPIDRDVFEIPCFAFRAFRNLVLDENYEKVKTLAIELKIGKARHYYKTFSRNMMDDLIHSAKDLLSDVTVDYEDGTRTYYVAQGLVLNEELFPVFSCSWEIVREQIINGYNFYIIKPIIRVSPECFIQQKDAMQRYISKKIPTKALPKKITNLQSSDYIFGNNPSEPSFVVEESPFVVKRHIVPSINITRDEMWQVVKNHINDATII